MLLIYDKVVPGAILRKEGKLFVFKGETIPKVAVVIAAHTGFTIGAPYAVRVFDHNKIRDLPTWQDIAAVLDVPLEEVKQTIRGEWAEYADNLDAVDEFLKEIE